VADDPESNLADRRAHPKNHICRRKTKVAAGLVLGFVVLPTTLTTADDLTPSGAAVPQRPAVMFNRRQEDRSVLAVPREPFHTAHVQF
jgi:hypothetical protein